jgi:transposase
MHQREKNYPGIGAITATTLVAEIIHIGRIATNDNLASCTGLGMKEHSTGNNAKLVPNGQLFTDGGR